MEAVAVPPCHYPAAGYTFILDGVVEVQIAAAGAGAYQLHIRATLDPRFVESGSSATRSRPWTTS